MLQIIKKSVWKFLLEFMKFNSTLRSRIEIKIRNKGDWTIYNEIFANAEYDAALANFIEAHKFKQDTIHILDLGANVGFFSLRLCDLAIQNGLKPSRLHLVLVEADYRCLDTLRWHIEQLTKIGVSVSYYHGLAGKLSGESGVKLGRESFGTGVANHEKSGRNTNHLPYINLFDVHPNKGFYDLIKCDIEGSEFDFISAYADLLAHCSYLLIEFHPQKGDIDVAEKQLDKLGLKDQGELSDVHGYVTKYFKRFDSYR